MITISIRLFRDRACTIPSLLSIFEAAGICSVETEMNAGPALLLVDAAYQLDQLQTPLQDLLPFISIGNSLTDTKFWLERGSALDAYTQTSIALTQLSNHLTSFAAEFKTAKASSLPAKAFGNKIKLTILKVVGINRAIGATLTTLRTRTHAGLTEHGADFNLPHKYVIEKSFEMQHLVAASRTLLDVADDMTSKGPVVLADPIVVAGYLSDCGIRLNKTVEVMEQAAKAHFAADKEVEAEGHMTRWHQPLGTAKPA